MGEKIQQLASPLLTDQNLFVVGVTISALQGPQKVTVVLDGDKGVTIDDCAMLSRNLSEVMEAGGLIGENFTLEVTTPGVDKPLQLKRQFVKNIGRHLKVHGKDKAILHGRLTDVDDDKIGLEQETGEGKKRELKQTTLAFADIEKAFVQVSFK